MKIRQFFLFGIFCLISLIVNGAEIRCSTSEELITALTTATGGDQIILTTSGIYIVQDDVEQTDPTALAGFQRLISLAGLDDDNNPARGEGRSITLLADEDLTAKPTVKGLSFSAPTTTPIAVQFEGIIFQACKYKYDKSDETGTPTHTDHFIEFGGNNNGIATSPTATATHYGNFIFRNCEFRDYQQTVLKMNSATKNTEISGRMTVAGCVFANFNRYRKAAPDAAFNIQTVAFSEITIVNCTAYNMGTGFLRSNMSSNNFEQTVSMSNCTFRHILGGNNKIFFDFDNSVTTTTVTVINNIIADPVYTIGENAGTGRLVRCNGSKYSFDFSGNNIFNWTVDGTNTLADIIGTGAPLNTYEPDNITPAIDPEFRDPDNGDFTLLTTNETMRAIGDPRWRTVQSSVKNVLADVNITVQGNQISISGSNPVVCTVFDTMGKLVFKSSETAAHINVQIPVAGVYAVQLSDGKLKETRKVILY